MHRKPLHLDSNPHSVSRKLCWGPRWGGSDAGGRPERPLRWGPARVPMRSPRGGPAATRRPRRRRARGFPRPGAGAPEEPLGPGPAESASLVPSPSRYRSVGRRLPLYLPSRNRAWKRTGPIGNPHPPTASGRRTSVGRGPEGDPSISGLPSRGGRRTGGTRPCPVGESDPHGSGGRVSPDPGSIEKKPPFLLDGSRFQGPAEAVPPFPHPIGRGLLHAVVDPRAGAVAGSALSGTPSVEVGAPMLPGEAARPSAGIRPAKGRTGSTTRDPFSHT